MRGRRFRGRKKRRTKAATVGGDDARKQFVDLAGCGIIAERCQAIQRYLGSVRQCRGPPADGSRLCGYHADHERWALARGEGLKYGRLDAEVFDAAIVGRWVKGDVQAGLRKLESAGHAPRRKAPQRKHWYTRHHMWQCALQVREQPENVGRGRLDYLEDLATEEMRAALTKVSSTLQRNEHLRRSADGDVFVEQGMGPKTVEECLDPVQAGYNGRDGGKIWTWYTRGVFEQQLAARGVDVSSCTE